MKYVSALSALALAAGLAACGPQMAAPEPGETVTETEAAGMPTVTQEPVPKEKADEASAWELTDFTPASNEVSKTDAEGTSTWLYANEARGLMVELDVTEVGDGFEYKSYKGTIQVTAPESGRTVPFLGTCGV